MPIVLCSLFSVSCELFSGSEIDLLAQIDAEVAWANADRLSVTVSYPLEWGNSPQNGTNRSFDNNLPNETPRRGYAFTVEFTPNTSYGFRGWLAFKSSEYNQTTIAAMGYEAALAGSLNGNGVTINPGEASNTGAHPATVIVNISDAITLIPFCDTRPRVDQQRTNPPVNPIPTPFPYDQRISIRFTMPVKMAMITLTGDNPTIRITGIYTSGDNRGQPINGDDGLNNHFTLSFSDITDNLYTDHITLTPIADTANELALLSVSVIVGPDIENAGGVAMAAAETISYQTDTTIAQKAYRTGTVRASREDGGLLFQDGEWNNPTIDRRFNYNDTNLDTAYIRFAIPNDGIPEAAPATPNRITIVERLAFDLGGYSSSGSIEVLYKDTDAELTLSGGFYTIEHKLQTRTSGIINLIVLPWHEENDEPLIQMLNANDAVAEGQYVCVVMDTAAPNMNDVGAVISGHSSVDGNIRVFGQSNTALTLTINRLNLLNDNGASGGIPVSQAYNRPWTMDERNDLEWRVLIGGVVVLDNSGETWRPVETDGVVNNVFTGSIGGFGNDTEFAVTVQFRDLMGNQAEVDTGLRIKRIEGTVSPVTSLSAAVNSAGNSITASWTTPATMTGASVYVNGVETTVTGTGSRNHSFTVPIIDVSRVREGTATSNVTRYEIRVEAYSAAGRATAQTITVWNIPGMTVNVNTSNTVILTQANFTTVNYTTYTNYVLTEDITLSNRTPVNLTNKNFYGNGHTITISGTMTANDSGLFGVVNGGTIRDLTVVYNNVTINPTAAARFGGIAGRAKGNAQLENVAVKGDVTFNVSGDTDAHVGGIVGLLGRLESEADEAESAATITNAYSSINLTVEKDYTGAATASLYVAGVAGSMGRVGVTFSSANGAIIDGGDPVRVDRASAAGNITLGSSSRPINVPDRIVSNIAPFQGDVFGLSAGGLTGFIRGTAAATNASLTNSEYKEGNISLYSGTGRVNFGGAVGMSNMYVTVSNCSSKASAFEINKTGAGTLFYAGGFVGNVYSSSTITNCYNEGPVVVNTSDNASGTIYAGGFAGIVNAFNGNYNSRVSYCYAVKGNVSVLAFGGVYAGGFCGRLYQGSLQSSYATGNVSVLSRSNNNVYAGGMSGESSGSYCYATGDVYVGSTGTGTIYAGGFSGETSLSITGFAAGSVTVERSRAGTTYASGISNSSGSTYGNLHVAQYFVNSVALCPSITVTVPSTGTSRTFIGRINGGGNSNVYHSQYVNHAYIGMRLYEGTYNSTVLQEIIAPQNLNDIFTAPASDDQYYARYNRLTSGNKIRPSYSRDGLNVTAMTLRTRSFWTNPAPTVTDYVAEEFNPNTHGLDYTDARWIFSTVESLGHPILRGQDGQAMGGQQ